MTDREMSAEEYLKKVLQDNENITKLWDRLPNCEKKRIERVFYIAKEMKK